MTNTSAVTIWKLKGYSDEPFKFPSTSDNSLNPRINHYDTPEIQIHRSCLK